MKIIFDHEEQRADVFLSNELDISRSKIQKLLKEGKIYVNGSFVKSGHLLKKNDVIEIIDFELQKNDIVPEKLPLDIVYEDDDLLVINKQNGLVVHPGAGNWQGTLVNALVYYFENLSQKDEKRPGIVHRLDAYTTGLMVVAKNDYAHDFLANQLSKNKMLRKYYALVWGVILNESGTIEAPLGRDLKNRKKYTVTSLHSKKAITHFKVIKRFEKATLIEVSLETGRTHQIRVHLNYINHPIVNDPVYSNYDKIDDSGQCLHAKTIGFEHPRTGQQLVFESDLPACFKNILLHLGGDSNGENKN